MQLQTQEQVQHDRVNLARLAKALKDTDWQRETQSPGRETWVKVQTTLQKVRHARRLLKNVELNTDPNNPIVLVDDYQGIQNLLDGIEAELKEAQKRVTPELPRPTPLLPTLPLPAPTTPKTVPPPISVDSAESEPPQSPEQPNTALSAQDLLLSPSETIPESFSDPPLPEPNTSNTAPLPPFSRSPSGPSAPATTDAILKNSRAVQEELSEQLAQMASQLKRNAIHFASSLEKDKTVVLETQEKLERNYTVMTKERTRLRDHRSKSWGTTWITILSIVVVIVGFILSFFVIRFTGRQ